MHNATSRRPFSRRRLGPLLGLLLAVLSLAALLPPPAAIAQAAEAAQATQEARAEGEGDPKEGAAQAATDQQETAGCPQPEARQFDFLLGEHTIANRIRKPDGSWDESEATVRGEKHLGGCLIVDHFEGKSRHGHWTEGITLRAFDPATGVWSIVWLDNRQSPDFSPLTGTFEDGVGEFYQQIDYQGTPVTVRFRWDRITGEGAHWAQSYSVDGGESWTTTWEMTLTKR